MEHGEGRNGGHEAALRAVQRAPAKPWRGAGAGGTPPPPRVYRVEPRDFRELVQRLTGAGAATTGPPAVGARQAPAHAAAAHGRREAAPVEQFDYSSWFSAPLLSPASMPAGMDGHHGALLEAAPVEQFDYSSWFSAPLLSRPAWTATMVLYCRRVVL